MYVLLLVEMVLAVFNISGASHNFKMMIRDYVFSIAVDAFYIVVWFIDIASLVKDLY